MVTEYTSFLKTLTALQTLAAKKSIAEEFSSDEH